MKMERGEGLEPSIVGIYISLLKAHHLDEVIAADCLSRLATPAYNF